MCRIWAAKLNLIDATLKRRGTLLSGGDAAQHDGEGDDSGKDGMPSASCNE